LAAVSLRKRDIFFSAKHYYNIVSWISNLTPMFTKVVYYLENYNLNKYVIVIDRDKRGEIGKYGYYILYDLSISVVVRNDGRS